MAVMAQALPPRKTAYDYPIVGPGQELTPQQEEQKIVARIAGIVAATATTKVAIEAATTNQLVALLRVSDLLTEAGVKAFAKTAALIVTAAIRQARIASWSSTSARAKAAGATPPTSMPTENNIPRELRYSRGTDIETAYSRIAEEYKLNLERTEDDPIIKDLIEQFESQGLTPLPRPDNLSSDAVRSLDGEEEEWEKAFLRAEKASQGSSRKDPIAEISAKDAEPTQGAGGTRGEEAQWNQRDVEVLAGDDTPSPDSSLTRLEWPSQQAQSEVEEPETPRLASAEIRAIIEKYAEKKAEERAERMVSQDVTATIRNTQQAALRTMNQKQIRGFRRVVHPELAKSGHSCGLCIVASTMIYSKRDLMPIHAGCNCGIAEIYEVNGDIIDPGDQINMSDLEVFYREAGDTTHGWSLKRQRYEIQDNPEYGPTLVNISNKKLDGTAEPVRFTDGGDLNDRNG